jgi:4-amino-4-deoxychorismate lyase
MNLTEKSIYPFFETIRIEANQVELTAYHQRRLDHVFRSFYPGHKSFDLNAVLVDRLNDLDGIVKCRFQYNSLKYKIEMSAYRKRNIDKIHVVNADNLVYAFKYNNRDEIDQYTDQFTQNEDCLFAVNGRITDTSYGNILFSKDDKWYTPLYPLFYGIQRANLLSSNRIETRDILIGDIQVYDRIKIINAMMPPKDAISLDVSSIFLS